MIVHGVVFDFLNLYYFLLYVSDLHIVLYWYMCIQYHQMSIKYVIISLTITRRSEAYESNKT